MAYLMKHSYVLLKSGDQIQYKLLLGRNAEETARSISESCLQVISKLLERNKNKGGIQVRRVGVSCPGSIEFNVY